MWLLSTDYCPVCWTGNRAEVYITLTFLRIFQNMVKGLNPGAETFGMLLRCSGLDQSAGRLIGLTIVSTTGACTGGRNCSNPITATSYISRTLLSGTVSLSIIGRFFCLLVTVSSSRPLHGRLCPAPCRASPVAAVTCSNFCRKRSREWQVNLLTKKAPVDGYGGSPAAPTTPQVTTPRYPPPPLPPPTHPSHPAQRKQGEEDATFYQRVPICRGPYYDTNDFSRPLSKKTSVN